MGPMVSMGFMLGLVALLATPGPTNTLLPLGAAERRSLRTALPLLAAELAAYLTAVVAVGLIADRLLGPVDGARFVLQVAAAVYLGWLAWRLWRRAATKVSAGAVTPRMVAMTTLGNPKAFIIALPLMPAGAFQDAAVLLPHLAALAVVVPLAGGCWILMGMTLSRSNGSIQRALPRAASLALLLFSAALMRSAVLS
jgi:threonine/homoserine/homoserine lactone efflux protein